MTEEMRPDEPCWRAPAFRAISVWQRSLTNSTAKTENHTMLGFCRDGTAVALVLLNALALIAAADEEVIFTDHFLVQLHEGTNEDAHQLALEHGFGSARKVSGSMRSRTPSKLTLWCMHVCFHTFIIMQSHTYQSCKSEYMMFFCTTQTKATGMKRYSFSKIQAQKLRAWWIKLLLCYSKKQNKKKNMPNLLFLWLAFIVRIPFPTEILKWFLQELPNEIKSSLL